MRVGMVVGLRPERVADYTALHAKPWPEMDSALKEANIHQYSIFLKEPENLLFGVWDYRGTDYEGDMKRLGEKAVTTLAGADRSLPVAAGISQAGRMVELHGLRLPSRLIER